MGPLSLQLIDLMCRVPEHNQHADQVGPVVLHDPQGWAGSSNAADFENHSFFPSVRAYDNTNEYDSVPLDTSSSVCRGEGPGDYCY